MRSPIAARATMPSLPSLAKPDSLLLSRPDQPLPIGGPIAASTSSPKALVTIIPELCKGCELCIYACPSGNLTLSPGLNGKGYHPAVFSYNGSRGPCTACGICYWTCPDMAISEIRRLKQ